MTKVSTIGALLAGDTKWCWAYCTGRGCYHYSPIALAPFAIRWGLDASSDLIRRRLRCTACGNLGCTLRTPSWQNIVTGWAPWPG